MDLLKFYYGKFLCSSQFTYFCKVSAQGGLVNSWVQLCVTSCLLWNGGTYFWIYSGMLNCVIFKTLRVSGFVSCHCDQTSLILLFTLFYCFWVIYFRFCRYFSWIACKKMSSQRVCWKLDFISFCSVRCVQQHSFCTLVPEKKSTVLPRMDSVGNSFPIRAKTIGTVCRIYSLRKQLPDPATQVLSKPYCLWAWLSNTSQFLSQNQRYSLCFQGLDENFYLFILCLNLQTAGLTSCQEAALPFLSYLIKWTLVNS